MIDIVRYYNEYDDHPETQNCRKDIESLLEIKERVECLSHDGTHHQSDSDCRLTVTNVVLLLGWEFNSDDGVASCAHH